MKNELKNILDIFLDWKSIQPILCRENEIVNVINYLNSINLATFDELRDNIYNNIFLFETEDKTFKIEQTREIIEKASIKPADKFNIFIIHEIDKLSLWASNSLLKLLEDVPTWLLILLTTKSKDDLLDTIKSRILDFWSDEISYEISYENREVIDAFFSWDKMRINDIVFWERIDKSQYIAILEYILHKLKSGRSYSEELVDNILHWIEQINTTNTNPKYIFDSIILEL